MCYLALGMTLCASMSMLTSNLVFADNSNVASVPVGAVVTKTTPVSPEEKSYLDAMIKLSTAIAQKISEIQAKQKAIDSEVYLTEVPSLQGEKKTLQNELEALQMRKTELESKKSAQEMTQRLEVGDAPG